MPHLASLLYSVMLALVAVVPAAQAEPTATQPAATQPATTQPAATQPDAQAPARGEGDADQADADTDDKAEQDRGEAAANDAEADTGAAADAARAIDISPELDALLDRLEAATKDLDSLEARVVYDRIQGLLGDRQRRFGNLVYIAGPPARFAVHLDKLLIDGAARPQDRQYIFDGRWLLEKVVDNNGAKRFTRWQLVPPQVDPAEADPLGKGDGPFALPIRINKAQLLQRFDIEQIEPTEDDARIHLRLTPREPQDVDFHRLELWYDADTLLPEQVYTLDDPDSENETIIRLIDVKPNVEVDAGAIDTTPPTGRGWRGEVKPWRE